MALFFERLTRRARRALFFARYKALENGSRAIYPEHLLLGLTQDSAESIRWIFASSGSAISDVHEAAEREVSRGESIPASIEIPFAADTADVLKFARDEADRLVSDYIGPEHLLLGLLRSDACDPAHILNRAGITLEAVRRRLTFHVSDAAVDTQNRPSNGT